MTTDILKTRHNIELMNSLITSDNKKDISTLDILWNSWMVYYNPENGFVDGKKISEMNKAKLITMLQVEAKDITINNGGFRVAPSTMLAELETRELRIEVVQVCTGLSVDSIELLRAEKRYPYLMQAWGSVFYDLDIKLNGVGVEHQPLYRSKCKSLAYEIYTESGIDFIEPETAIRYICKNGIDVITMSRMLNIGSNALTKVLNGEKTFSKTAIISINRLLREQF